jgi:tetratricopeptide (TPR) repeat protein
LTEASRRYAEEVEQFEAALKSEPSDRQVQSKLATSLYLHRAEILAITGDLERARETLARAREILEPLVAYDPANYQWTIGLFTVQLREAIVALATGPRERAEPFVASTRKAVEKLTAKQSSDRRSSVRLVIASRVEAEWLHAMGRPDAKVAAARAVELAEKAILQRPNVAETAECAQARILAGRIAFDSGDTETARRDWQRADELLAPRIADSRHWRLLDPAARVAALLGREDQAQALISELKHIGYVPLQPWPEVIPSL